MKPSHLFFLLFAVLLTISAPALARHRSTWVWDVDRAVKVMTIPASYTGKSGKDYFLNFCQARDIARAYINLTQAWMSVASNRDALRAMIQDAHGRGIEIWYNRGNAPEHMQVYGSPGYASLTSEIAYVIANYQDDATTVSMNARFDGYMHDIEFHEVGVSPAHLQAYLDTVRDLGIYWASVSGALPFGGSLTYWTDKWPADASSSNSPCTTSSGGTPLMATWNSQTRPVYEHMMLLHDLSVIMAYRTEVAQAIAISSAEVAFADAQGLDIEVGMETNENPGLPYVTWFYACGMNPACLDCDFGSGCDRERCFHSALRQIVYNYKDVCSFQGVMVHDFHWADVSYDTVSGYDLNQVPDGDDDGDGLPNHWEISNGLDPGDYADGFADPDADGWQNLDELANDTNPFCADAPPVGTPSFTRTPSPDWSKTPTPTRTPTIDPCSITLETLHGSGTPSGGTTWDAVTKGDFGGDPNAVAAGDGTTLDGNPDRQHWWHMDDPGAVGVINSVTLHLLWQPLGCGTGNQVRVNYSVDNTTNSYGAWAVLNAPNGTGFGTSDLVLTGVTGFSEAANLRVVLDNADACKIQVDHLWIEIDYTPVCNSPTPSAVVTATHTSTPTTVFTATHTSTPTPVFTATYTSTSTPVFTVTYTSTPTAVFTATYTSTSTPVVLATFSHSPTPTPVETHTPAIITPSRTATPSVTFSPVASLTHTGTLTPLSTATYTPVFTATMTTLVEHVEKAWILPAQNPSAPGPGQPLTLWLAIPQNPGQTVRNKIQVSIFSAGYTKVAQLTCTQCQGNPIKIDWDGSTLQGTPAASGLYFVVASYGVSEQVRTTLLILR